MYSKMVSIKIILFTCKGFTLYVSVIESTRNDDADSMPSTSKALKKNCK